MMNWKLNDDAADLAAELEAELEILCDEVRDNFDWQHFGAGIVEMAVNHKDFDSALIGFMRGDMAMLNAICDEEKERVVLRLAKKKQKKGLKSYE
jgi:hypothetical protein